MRLRGEKWVSLWGTVLLIPWDLFWAFGITFSFKGNNYDPFLDRAFVVATFYFTVPAVVASWAFPKIGAYTMLFSVTISILIEVIRKITWYLTFLQHPYKMERPLLFGLFLEFTYIAFIFWIPKTAFAVALLAIVQSGKRRDAEMISGRKGPRNLPQD